MPQGRAVPRRAFLYALSAAAVRPATGALWIPRPTPLAVSVDTVGAPDDFAAGVAFGLSSARRHLRLASVGEAGAMRVSWAPALGEQGAELSSGEVLEGCVFRTSVPVASRARRVARWLAGLRHERRWQVLYSAQMDHSARIIAERFAAEGLKVTATAHVTAPLASLTTPAMLISGDRHDIAALRARGFRAMLVSLCEPAGEAGDTAEERWIADWHASVDDPGARDLNRRFRRSAGRSMSSPAWHGWVATRALAEAAAAGDDTDACRTLRTLRFDGCKGTPVVFGEDTHLDQPLFVVEREGPDETIVAII